MCIQRRHRTRTEESVLKVNQLIDVNNFKVIFSEYEVQMAKGLIIQL
jgi:hypothetical protein